MPDYVVGFLFNEALDKVVLIQKTKPNWQKGQLNGVGGKVEPGETHLEAMEREFWEETGVSSDTFSWIPFVEFVGDRGEVFMVAFYAVTSDDDLFYSAKTTTEELVTIIMVEDIPYLKSVLPNVKWLIPLATTACYTEPTNFFASVRIG